MLTIHDHYWSGKDFGLYSSARQAIVEADDAIYRDWCAAGGVASRWPRDEEGNESEQALADVLACHGLRLYPPALEERIENRCAEVDALREEKLERGVRVGGHIYDSDETSQVRLMGGILATASFEPGQRMAWITKDNATVELDKEELTSVAQAVSAYVSGCVLAARKHKDALQNLDSLDALVAYDIEWGWPE